METSLLDNGRYFYKKKVKDYSLNINGYELPKRTSYHVLVKIFTSLITVVIISLYIKSNNSSNMSFTATSINKDLYLLFNALGFPVNSKDFVYSRVESWGFNLSEIGEKEINKNYKEENLKSYKYSKYTYKKILFSNFGIKEKNGIKKNILLYKFLYILKNHPIETFYDFLNTFIILQDLNCLPAHYKGIYTNGKLFVTNNLGEVTFSVTNNLKTVVNEEPFLYITYHGGKKKNSIHNVCKFSRDGYFLGSVLLPFEEKGKFFNLISPRGLLINKNYLYVNDSFKNNSKIFKFSNTIPELSYKREYIQTFIEQNDKNNPLMNHPYDIKKNNNYFYVSSQNTGTVLRFDEINGKLGKPKEELKEISDGLVVQFNKNEGIRGIDFDNLNNFYVANKQKGVHVYDPDFNLIHVISVVSPISVLFDKETNHIFVGSSITNDIKEYTIGTTPENAVENVTENVTENLAENLVENVTESKTTNHNAHSTDNPTNKTTDPTNKTIDPINKTIDPTNKATDPTNKTIDPTNKTTDPTNKTIDPTNKTTDPTNNNFDLVKVIKHDLLKHVAGIVIYKDSIFAISQKNNKLLEFSLTTGLLKNVVIIEFSDRGERIILSST
ncbi:conserved protein, unknown function [Hepatocystis sp. ex Piliocolobus tephrosceles]|nr:conserved protein, unknown function [Hepatocystis sp. ex Piliocolobus tephrosceles]